MQKNKCKLRCLENNQTLDAMVLDYKPAYMMTCLVDKRVRMILRYNTAEKKYMGRVGTLEFMCDGPY